MKPCSIIIGLVLLFGLSGCSRTDRATTAFEIGCVLSLTGEVSKYGEDAQNGIMLAVAELQAEGKQVRVHIADSKSNPRDGINAYRQLRTAHNIRACISMISGITRAIAPMAHEDDVFHFATVAAAPDLFTPQMRAYRWYYTGELLAAEVAQYIKRSQQAKRISVLAENIEYSKAAAAALANLLASNKISIKMEVYDAKTAVARDLVAKVLSDKPEILVLLGSGGAAAANILIVLREQGFTGTILSDDSVSFPHVLKACGKAADGVIFFSSSFNGQDLTNPFVNAYHRKYGKFPSDISAFAYDMVRILCSAPDHSSAERLDSYVAGLKNYSSVLGTVNAIKERRELSVPISPKRIYHTNNNEFEFHPVRSNE